MKQTLLLLFNVLLIIKSFSLCSNVLATGFRPAPPIPNYNLRVQQTQLKKGERTLQAIDHDGYLSFLPKVLARVNGKEITAFEVGRFILPNIYKSVEQGKAVKKENVRKSVKNYIQEFITKQLYISLAEKAGLKIDLEEGENEVKKMKKEYTKPYIETSRYDKLYTKMLELSGYSDEEILKKGKDNVVRDQLFKQMLFVTYYTYEEMVKEQAVKIMIDKWINGNAIKAEDIYVTDAEIQTARKKELAPKYETHNVKQRAIGSTKKYAYVQIEKNAKYNIMLENAKLRVYHILIKTPKKDEQNFLKYEVRAIKIRQKLKAGESFFKLAKKYSECKSAKKNGYLGLLEIGKMDKNMENAVLSLKPGEFSEVVETYEGYHIFYKPTEEFLNAEMKKRLIKFKKRKLEEERLKKLLAKARKKAKIKIYKF